MAFPRWKESPPSPATQSGTHPAFRTDGPPASGVQARHSIVPKVYEDETDASVATEVIDAGLRAAAEPRLTFMTGPSAGRIVSLDIEGVYYVGRSHSADLRLDEPAISRRHCRFVRTAEGVRLEDLGSRNGVLVNGERVADHVLEPGDRIQLGDTILQYALLDRAEDTLARRLFEASTRDPLTNAANRRHFEERFDSEVLHAARHHTRVSLLVIDLDHFKRVNDTFGHAAGDVLLRAVVRAIEETIRPEDLLARIGGEELAVLARGTSAADAALLGERIRARIEALTVEHERVSLRATVSVGVAELDPTSPESCMATADARLYRAKAGGRNRVCAI